MTRVLDLPPGISQTDPWPYTAHPLHALRKGNWGLLMDAAGNTAIWPTDAPVPEELGMLPVGYRTDTREPLDTFLQAFCRHGHHGSPARYPHQDGWHAIFNWVSGTLPQLAIASQVLAAENDPDEPDPRKRRTTALSIGAAFADQIQAALKAAGHPGH